MLIFGVKKGASSSVVILWTFAILRCESNVVRRSTPNYLERLNFENPELIYYDTSSSFIEH